MDLVESKGGGGGSQGGGSRGSVIRGGGIRRGGGVIGGRYNTFNSASKLGGFNKAFPFE